MMETVLETTQLCKSYRRFRALDGVTMRVPKEYAATARFIRV